MSEFLWLLLPPILYEIVELIIRTSGVASICTPPPTTLATLDRKLTLNNTAEFAWEMLSPPPDENATLFCIIVFDIVPFELDSRDTAPP
jgi:hypothetical protein